MSDPDRDYREGLDQLQSDMASHQRRYVGQVTADANQRLAVDVIERLEKQDAAAADPVPSTAPVSTHEIQTRTVNGREYTIDKAPDHKMYRSATEFEHQVMAHAQPRIELLLSKYDEGPLGTPSWNQKTLAAMYFKVKSLEAIKSGNLDEARIYERAFQQDLSDLLEASNALFGDWRKDSPTRVTVSG